MIDFNQRHWYYLSDDGRVFSCSRCVVVAKDDPAYVAFLAGVAPGGPLPWPKDTTGAQTNAALDAALSPIGLSSSGPLRFASTYQLMSALTDAQRALYAKAVKPWDQRLFGARDRPWPEANGKIARIAPQLDTTPSAWFDAALAPSAS